MTDPLSRVVSLPRPGKIVSRSPNSPTLQNLRPLSSIHKGRRNCKPDLGYALSHFFEHTTQVLLALAMIMSLAGAHAQSLPKGGQYIAGSGSIASSGAAMTIAQSSARGIINWQGFSIGSANAVHFNNGSGATLNQVLGGNLSAIEGELTATGSVYLINPNGIVVGPGGKVITGGSFIGSTLSVSNQRFMRGGALDFSGGLTSLSGAVINNGKIVSQNGNVTLIGNSVTNTGSIFAPQGTVALAAGNQVLLKPLNGPAGIYVAAGKSGNVTNSGQIKAAAVALESAGGNVYELAGNRNGLIDATGIRTINGQVWLTAPKGSVTVSGKIEAKNSGGTGGTITAKGKNVTLEAGSVLNAAGTRGGGEIETSGQSVSLGNAIVTAGRGGTWTIDPTDLTIDSTAASTIDSSLNGGTNVTEETTATGASGSGTQSSGAGDVNVDAALSWSSSAGLTLSAFNSINVNAPVAVSGSGSLTLTTDNNVGGSSSGGALNFASSIQFNGTGGALTINGNAYTLIQNMTGLQSVSITGYYALAKNLDATGVTGFTPIGGGTAFTGTFNGLGNTVSNLVISSTSFSEVGLFGQIGSGGVVENIGLVGGSVTDANSFEIGGLTGYNNGTITNSYETGAVTSGSGGLGSEAGGLVGYNHGTISNSYAAGAVSDGSSFGGNLLGGLVGYNNGTITNSYATGAVTSANYDDAGGLAGYNFGTITDAYATGAVSGGSYAQAGGLIGYQ
ncbi:MAG: beta strand repeat-containing protein, partial [Terriglobia bacterium]